MKLLLFALLCFLTILLLRSLRGSGGRKGPPDGGAGKKPPPAASPDEIVDVHYVDAPPKDREREGS